MAIDSTLKVGGLVKERPRFSLATLFRDRGWVWWVGAALLTLLAAATGHPPVAALVVLLSPPVVLLVYVELHERAHRVYSESTPTRQAAGLAFAMLLGFSWRIYLGHHANHHRYNDAEGDFAVTADRNGRPRNGTWYLAKNAVFPFLIQCIPYLSVCGMRSRNRNAVAWLDESLRVSFRLLWLVVFGVQGLIVLLLYQVSALAFVIYVNYLQHFGTETPRRWTSELFNGLYRGFGIHDAHHRQPTRPGESLQSEAKSPSFDGFTIFNPLTFILFCSSSVLLHGWVGTQRGASP